MEANGKVDSHVTFTIQNVVERGMCIGCGVCRVAAGCPIPLNERKLGICQPQIDEVPGNVLDAMGRVCPFSDTSPDEDELGPPSLDSTGVKYHDAIGRYSALYAGRATVSDDEIKASSSGGLTSWLLHRLLDEGDIDAVITVAPSQNALFDYRTSTKDDLNGARKSHYYATSLTDVLEQARTDERRYALVGVPCFIKGVRSLCRVDKSLADRIKFFVALVCGHMKTEGFAKYMAWQVGVAPDRLSAVDFRVKDEHSGAGDYRFAARDFSGDQRTARSKALIGSNWGHALFQPNACNYCDDVFGETADVTFGDAWLRRYSMDWRGTNIVVSRNTRVDELFNAALTAGVVDIEELSESDLIASQAGNFRHRRTGLALRLADDISAGLAVPCKRVEPSVDSTDPKRVSLIRMRRELSAKSLLLFDECAAGATSEGMEQFDHSIRKEIRRYDRSNRTMKARIKDRARPIVGRIGILATRLRGKRHAN